MRPTNIQMKQKSRSGFTLVEVLTVVIIIGILAALLVPAIQNVIRKGKQTAIEMEISNLSQAIEAYKQKYGDYPPDYSNLPTAIRSLRRAFQQMATEEVALITSLCSDANGNFDPTAINRAQALVLAVRGYSSDKTHPFTGKGGPFEVIDPSQPLSPANVRFNPDTDNKLFDIDLSRLSGSGLIPVLVPAGLTQPYVYFDSRTYGIVATDSNGNPIANGYYVDSTHGGVRPYLSSLSPKGPSGQTYGTANNALNAFRFQKADSFQIISAGLDDNYGSLVFEDMSTMSGLPVHFIGETGEAVVPNKDAANVSELKFQTISGFQDSAFSSENLNGHFDNITNFFTGTLESNLP